MMRRIAVATALLALVGCEQETQTLPFDVETSVTRPVSSQGGTVSTPAGASVHFPSNSLSSTVDVSVATTSAPAEILRTGAPASEAFRIEPVGTVLDNPADLALKFQSTTDPSRAWLATIVSSANGAVRHYGTTRVDLSLGIVSADIEQLGVVAAVIPPASAIFPVQVLPSASIEPSQLSPVASSVESVVVQCGDAADPCSGLTVSASQNLLNQVEDAAVVYPSIDGSFTVGSSSVTGTITATAALRIKLQSGQTAESVEFHAVLQPTAGTAVIETASEIRFTNVLHRISGATDNESGTREEITTLVVPKSDGAGQITVDRQFEIRTAGGGLEPARVTLTFPVTINQ